jgi:magnesium-transporting ATPase (P-type)
MYQPLAFIVFVSACRAAKEDWDKHKADAQRNGFKYGVLKKGQLVDTESGDIRVGDIVKVMQNNMIPADMLFLGSALTKGHCFIDKSNLNGETTLEVMNSMVQTRPFAKDEKTLQGLSLSLTYEAPNKRFDSFRGQCQMRSGSQEEYSVDGKSLMMRETNLRNCDYVWGLVVYTGNDTKIQRSNLEGEKPKTKVSYIMRTVNKYLMYMLLLQSVLCLVGGILAGIFRDGFTEPMWFLGWEVPGASAPDGPRSGIFAFFSWFILLSQMVPISLIVSGELVKFVQSLFIEQDIQLYYAKLNKPTKCNSSTIHEDLGLIESVYQTFAA